MAEEKQAPVKMMLLGEFAALRGLEPWQVAAMAPYLGGGERRAFAVDILDAIHDRALKGRV